MRWVAAIVALCVCSCYSPHYGDCLVTCQTTGDCPDEFSCDGKYCRNGTSQQDCVAVLGDAALAGDALRVDVPTGPDSDGDGTPNIVDNCPNKPNADQADEDGDGAGDVCDVCPPYDNYFDFFQMAMKDADLDEDGDGVGDGCDPDSTAMNHIVLFEGFKAKPAGNAQFVESGAQWTFDGDASASLTASNQRLSIGWPSPSGFFFVYTSVKWIGDTGTNIGAGTFLLSTPPAANDGWACTLWNQGGGTPHVLALVDLPTTISAGDSNPLDFETGGSYQARVGFNPPTSTVSCSLQATAMSSMNTSTIPMNAAAGITANGMSAKFHWVMIVN